MLEPAENVVLQLFNILGARALVTGGGSGLGRAMAIALRDAGAEVAIVGRSEKLLAGKRDGFVPVMRDLSVPEAAFQVVAECVKSLGGLDILVNAHGVATRAKAEEFDLTAWQNTVNINLVSVFRMCQAAGREFLRTGHGCRPRRGPTPALPHACKGCSPARF